MRSKWLILALLSSLLWGTPVRAHHLPTLTGVASQLGACDHVFASTTLRYTQDYGASYALVSPIALAYLRTITACALTSPVTLGAYQPLGFMADQLTMVVYSSPDGMTYYVHREWKLYALTAAQWKMIVLMVNVRGAR